MSTETHNVLLLCQLQDGLGQELMMAPSVLGAQPFSEIRQASSNKEKRLIDFKRCQHHQ